MKKPLHLLVLLIPLFALSGYYIIQYFAKLPSRVTWHWANSHVESQPVWGAMQVARNQPMYTDYTVHVPAVPLTYGSLAYYLPGKTAQYLSITDARSIAKLLRVFAALGFFGAVILVVLLAQRYGVPFRYAILAPVPIFWFPYICEWSGKGMPDFPAISFSLLGWLLADSYMSAQKSTRVALAFAAAFSWAIAWHFKPIVLTGLLCYLSTALYPLSNSERRKHFLSVSFPVLLFGGLVVCSASVLTYITDGLWFKHVVGSTKGQLWNAPSAGFLVWGIGETMLLPVLALMVVVALRFHSVSTGLLLDFLFAGVLLLKEGATVNYFAGFVCAFGVFAAVLCKRFRYPDRKGLVASIGTVIILCIVLFMNRGATRIFMRETVGIPVREVEIAADAMHLSPKLLCLNPFFSLVYDVPCPFMDGFHAVILERAGVKTFTKVADQIANGDVELIIGDYFMALPPSNVYGPLIPVSINTAVRSYLEPMFAGKFLVVSGSKDLKESSSAN